MVFEPVANGVTSKATCGGAAALTFARAWAIAFGPTCEPLGQADGPSFSSLVAEHFLKSLVVSVSWLGPVIFREAAVCLVSVLVTVSFSVLAFGLDVEPALLGDNETLTLDVGVWA